MSDVRVIRVDGDVDIARAPTLREELRRGVGNRDVGLVVDLSAARYMDSAGVNVMFELAEELAQRQLAFAVVVAPGGLLERVIGLVDLGAVASVHASVDAATAAMRSAA